MKYHTLYGPVLPDNKWVPAPSYLLRRARIFSMLAGEPKGMLLEIGCGAGTLLHELSRQGHDCSALETSPAALVLAGLINENDAEIRSVAGLDWKGKFDYVLAFEVLEHIEDDRSALELWFSWLKPGGMLLISVPAHMRKWTASDVWAGHYRRYEQRDLHSLISTTGFAIQATESYGFPLANLLQSWRSRIHIRELVRRGERAKDRNANNHESGVERSAALRLYPLLDSLPGKFVMRAALLLQQLTVHFDLGTGYLLKARKPAKDIF